MPVVVREGGFRFHFYSNEGDPREPVHVHVAQPGVRRIIAIVEARRTEIENAWNDYFGAGN